MGKYEVYSNLLASQHLSPLLPGNDKVPQLTIIRDSVGYTKSGGEVIIRLNLN